MTDPSESSPVLALSRRERLIQLCGLNREWIQWHMDDMLDGLPPMLVRPAIHILKSKTDGEVSREELWRMVPYALRRMDDDTFNALYQGVMQFLGQL